MVGMLQREEVDIQLGALTILAAREQVFDDDHDYRDDDDDDDDDADEDDDDDDRDDDMEVDHTGGK